MLSKELLEELILNINNRPGIRNDILEKDYYVCLVLKDLSSKQEKLQAYFKGGTAVYKVLNHMNRFSEDIDLTVKINENESNNSNKTRLKNSALGYKIEGLELVSDETIDKKGSITSFYKYNSIFSLSLSLLNMCNRQTESGPPDIPITILSPDSIKLCLFIVLSTFSKTIFIPLTFSFFITRIYSFL